MVFPSKKLSPISGHSNKHKSIHIFPINWLCVCVEGGGGGRELSNFIKRSIFLISNKILFEQRRYV